MISVISIQSCSRINSTLMSLAVRPPTVVSTCRMKIVLLAKIGGGNTAARLNLESSVFALSVSSLSIVLMSSVIAYKIVLVSLSSQGSVKFSKSNLEHVVASRFICHIVKFQL